VAPTPVEAARQVLAVQDLLAYYCVLVDEGRPDALGEIFAPDAVMTIAGMGPEPRRWEGLDAIIDFVAQRQTPDWRGLHILSMPRVEIGDGEARSRADVLFVNRSGPDGQLVLATMGTYEDRLRLQGERWRIVDRSITMR
jgi:hypothetical protein